MIEHFEHTINPSTSTSTSTLSRIIASLSRQSVLTMFPPNGCYAGQLNDLCNLIGSYPTLQNARIVSAECHAESIALRIVHRFLVLELEREGKKNIWLRLDRRTAKPVGKIKFILNGGVTQANDTVSEYDPIRNRHSLIYGLLIQIRLSGRREALVSKRARRENQQHFRSPPTLLDLSHLLYAIIDQLTTYHLWPVSALSPILYTESRSN